MNNEENKPVRSIRTKIITIGDGAVGKTSIVQRYLGKGFEENYIPTFGAEFHTHRRKYLLDDGPIFIEWNLWDVAGQSKFEHVRSKYFLNAKAAIIVFDITRQITAKHTHNWIEDFYSTVGKHRPFVLLGNKVDLRGTEEEEVPIEEGERMAAEFSEKFGIDVPYLETSAKTNKNLEKAFEVLASKVVETYTRSIFSEEGTET